MSKSTLRPPVIADNSTRTAINELYKQVNKLLTSISPNAQDYAGDVLEGSVRAIYNGNNTFKIEGYTNKGWVGVAAQKQAGPNAYKDMPIISDNGHLTISKLTINNLSEIGSDTDKFLMSDSGVVKFVTGANLRSYIGAGTSNVTELSDLSDVTYTSGDLTITDIDTIIADDLTIDSNKKIILDGADSTGTGVNVAVYNDGQEVSTWRAAGASNFFTIFEPGASSDDKFFIRVRANGEAVLSTLDASASDADLTLDADGDINIDSATKVINFKHNGTTVGNYINPFIASAIFG